MFSTKKTGGLIRKIGRGFLWIGGKGLHFIFIYPLSPLFHAAKYLKLMGFAVNEIAGHTGQAWRQIRHSERDDLSTRDFQWCLNHWNLVEDDIDDRIMLWIAEIMFSIMVATVITWSAVEWNQFLIWIEFAVTVPALLFFISVKLWQITCLRQRRYITLKKV